VDLNAEDYKYGRTALHIAAEKGYTEMVTMLLIRGADMYATGDQFYSRTPLHLACIHGHTAVVRVLVKRGADVAVLSGFLDKNPLHLACENGHWEAAEILVNKGMDLDVCGNHVSSPVCQPRLYRQRIVSYHSQTVQTLLYKSVSDSLYTRICDDFRRSTAAPPSTSARS
jgi:hypothetical protein